MADVCSQCQQHSLVWGHRSATSRHRWEDGEGSCVCEPQPLCVSCQLPVMRDNGLLLLDDEAFPASTAVFLN